MTHPMIQNPIVRGFNPDPSICRCGDDYYIACSSFEYFPGIQIHHSRDLRNWRLLTRALDSVELLDLRGVDNSCGVWAPQLTFSGGLFYLIFANVSGVGGPITDSPNYLVTAPAITGPWSRPVYLRSGGFDPSIFHDSDGRIYYVNMQMGEPGGDRRFDGIWLQEYDPAAKKLTGPFRKIWDGTELRVTEGPHLYKRDGFYYLVAAEGGTSWNHAVSVARSTSLWGPYETMPGNPLMTAKNDPGLPLQSAGHADFVETPAGEMYMVHLAQRPLGTQCVDGETRRISPLGRESCIQKIEWPRGGWPRLADGTNLPRLEVEAPDLPEHTFPESSVRTDFRTGTLPVDFVTLREPLAPEWATFGKAGLELKGRESLNSRFRQSWVGRRLQHDSLRIETKVAFAPPTFRETAGLIVYYDRMNFLYLRLAGSGTPGMTKIGVISSENGAVTRCDAAEFPSDTPFFRLKIELRDHEYRFFFAPSDGAWREAEVSFPITRLGDGISRISGFTGTMVGICAQAVSGMDIQAVFEYFDYEEYKEKK